MTGLWAKKIFRYGTKLILQFLRFSQRCCYRFKSCGMLWCADWYLLYYQCTQRDVPGHLNCLYQMFWISSHINISAFIGFVVWISVELLVVITFLYNKWKSNLLHPCLLKLAMAGWQNTWLNLQSEFSKIGTKACTVLSTKNGEKNTIFVVFTAVLLKLQIFSDILSYCPVRS